MKILPFFFLLFTLPLCAQKDDRGFSEGPSGYELGLFFFRQNDYYNSITELKRYIFFASGKAKKEKALFYIGLNYLKGKEYSNAREAFLELYHKGEKAGAASSLLALADSYFAEEADQLRFRTDYYEESPLPFSTDYYLHYISEWKDDSYFNTEAYLKQSALFALNQDQRKADDYLKLYLSSTPEPLPQTGEYGRLIRKTGRLKKRSPTCAFLFSLAIPGLGQIYAGDTEEGLIALAVNGLMISGTLYSYLRYSRTLGVILGYYSITYYAGQLNNAVLAARRYNENQKVAFQKEIIRILF